jgi:glycosyltransferase involved in cell wall biosynthesis
MPSSTPTVSVITPAFNAEKTLAATLESAQAQRFGDFELIVIDDGSTDGTADIASRFAREDRRIRLMTQINAGAGAARNVAMAQARGEYFALLDSDDLWTPAFLDDQLAAFAMWPDAAVVTANAVNLGGPRSGEPLWPTSPPFERLQLIDIIERENAVCIMSVFRREVYERLGGFAERSSGDRHRPPFKGNEDYHFWLRAARLGFPIVANHTPGGYYRRRPNSLSADEGEMLRGIMAVLRDLLPACADQPAEAAAIRRQLRRFETDLFKWRLRQCVNRTPLVWALRAKRALQTAVWF